MMRDLSLALLELASNSVDAGAKSLKIEIWLDEGRVTVSDDGAGMTDEQLSRALAGGYGTKGGNGVGLSLTKLEAEKSGGELKVTSKAGEGTFIALKMNAPTGDIAQTVATLTSSSAKVELCLHRAGETGKFSFEPDALPKEIKAAREQINNFLRQNKE